LSDAPPWQAAEAELDALRRARHPDPFALLGPHETPQGRVIRTFLPGAEAAEARFASGVAPLLPRGGGVFEGLAAQPGPYRLHARNAAAMWSLPDPYAFGPTLGPLDDHLLLEGTHARLHERLGAHPLTHEGVPGVRFAVWAPHAQRVSVVGEFNAWDGRRHPMRRRVDSGIWELFLPELARGAPYKYELVGPDGVVLPLKADPFAFAAELRPATASLVHGLPRHAWGDAAWMRARATQDPAARPIAIHEVHAASWRRHPDGRLYDWDELAESLIPYLLDLGFTHVEFLPVSEHPLDASWGYQPIGLFAVTARHGAPEGFARFVDRAHQAGLGVILDWVPAHFPQDAHGLARFDGTPLYEHPDPRRGSHPDWGTLVYDYGRTEVQAFLISNALFWIEQFHLDGLRVDAVSSMLHLDYSRAPGEWAPNEDGSNVNRDAVRFLERVNAAVRTQHPGVLMIAEEATAWSGVSKPVAEGGLGFAFKWNMGWMNDTLRYVAKEPIHRRWHHDLVTFGLMYAWNERFVLPLSHDEVVHGKGTLLGRLPGDDWQRFATLRALYALMWAHPGKKLLFMGQEFAPWREWSEARECDWWLLQHAPHQGVQRLIRDLNALLAREPALHARDAEWGGFRWIDADDQERSVFSWLRFGGPDDAALAMVVNFTPLPRHGLRLGLPAAGVWREVLNTDAPAYGGSGVGNLGAVRAEAIAANGLPASAALSLPPLGALYLRHAGEGTEEDA
jgi:1,4-alpha-glucan branching enzyme